MGGCDQRAWGRLINSSRDLVDTTVDGSAIVGRFKDVCREMQRGRKRMLGGKGSSRGCHDSDRQDRIASKSQQVTPTYRCSKLTEHVASLQRGSKSTSLDAVGKFVVR